MFGLFDPLYLILLLPTMLLAGWAQWKVKSAYRRASTVRNSRGFTGAQAAATIMENAGIFDVSIEPSKGFLSDHYDPRHRVLRLSPDVYQGSSVAAVGIAAHEAGHAIQHNRGYAPLAIRNGLVPMASVGSNMAMVVFTIGLMLQYMTRGRGELAGLLMTAAIIMFAAVVLFQLVNLPVEFNASSRAKAELARLGIVGGAQAKPMNAVLNAAAMTYVAATLSAILTLVYFLIRAGVLGGRDD